MRPLTLIGLLLLAAPNTSAQEVGDHFAADLPPGIGDVSRWETVAGEFETKDVRGSYIFYVNPTRQALYQLMRYRVHLLAPHSQLERQRGSSERVAFVERPGSREPLLCWQLETPNGVSVWSPLRPGTAEYKMEMGVLMQVLAIHRALRLAPPSAH